MTDLIYFDTDCLSSFLWVGREFLLIRLYKDRIFLSQQVYREIVRIPSLKIKVNQLIQSKEFTLSDFQVGSPEHILYTELTKNPIKGRKIIGNGEASVICLAKCRDGIVGSNNFKDIWEYLDFYHLRHIATADILYEALENGLISLRESNTIWRDMRNKNTWLPEETFNDYLAKHKRN
jgi:predicted nucleic acid-binding protein